MKKSLLIIGAVAILGMLAVYAVPLSKNNSASIVSSNSASTSTTAETQTPSVQPTNSDNTVSASSSNSLKDGSFTGTSSSNEFGAVQIKLTISGGKITDVTALDYPASDRHSLEISQYAIPQLKQEVLAAQSAHIDYISGASYTSQSYIESLQSAINQAKV